MVKQAKITQRPSILVNRDRGSFFMRRYPLLTPFGRLCRNMKKTDILEEWRGGRVEKIKGGWEGLK